MKLKKWFVATQLARYIFPRVIIYTFFSYFASYGGLGVGVRGWGLEMGFQGYCFQLIMFGACSVGPYGFFWSWDFLDKHRRIATGRNLQLAGQRAQTNRQCLGNMEQSFPSTTQGGMNPLHKHCTLKLLPSQNIYSDSIFVLEIAIDLNPFYTRIFLYKAVNSNYSTAI